MRYQGYYPPSGYFFTPYPPNPTRKALKNWVWLVGFFFVALDALLLFADGAAGWMVIIYGMIVAPAWQVVHLVWAGLFSLASSKAPWRPVSSWLFPTFAVTEALAMVLAFLIPDAGDVGPGYSFLRAHGVSREGENAILETLGYLLVFGVLVVTVVCVVDLAVGTSKAKQLRNIYTTRPYPF